MDAFTRVIRLNRAEYDALKKSTFDTQNEEQSHIIKKAELMRGYVSALFLLAEGSSIEQRTIMLCEFGPL